MELNGAIQVMSSIILDAQLRKQMFQGKRSKWYLKEEELFLTKL